MVEFDFSISNEICDDRRQKMRFDQYACFGLPASPWFSFANSDRSGNPPAPTLVRSNLIRLPSLDWPSWLFLPALSALSYHLLADQQVSLHIADRRFFALEDCADLKHLPEAMARHVCDKYRHGDPVRFPDWNVQLDHAQIYKLVNLMGWKSGRQHAVSRYDIECFLSMTLNLRQIYHSFESSLS